MAPSVANSSPCTFSALFTGIFIWFSSSFLLQPLHAITYRSFLVLFLNAPIPLTTDFLLHLFVVNLFESLRHSFVYCTHPSYIDFDSIHLHINLIVLYISIAIALFVFVNVMVYLGGQIIRGGCCCEPFGCKTQVQLYFVIWPMKAPMKLQYQYQPNFLVSTWPSS